MAVEKEVCPEEGPEDVEELGADEGQGGASAIEFYKVGEAGFEADADEGQGKPDGAEGVECVVDVGGGLCGDKKGK